MTHRRTILESIKTIDDIEARLSKILSQVNPGVEALRHKLDTSKTLAQSQLSKLQLLASLDLSYQPSLTELLDLIGDIEHTLGVLNTPTSTLVVEGPKEFTELSVLKDRHSKMIVWPYTAQTAFAIRALACLAQSLLVHNPKHPEIIDFIWALDNTRAAGSDAGESCVFNPTLNDKLTGMEWANLSDAYIEGGLAFDVATWLKGKITPFKPGEMVSGAFSQEFVSQILNSIKARTRKITCTFVSRQMTGSDDYIKILSKNVGALAEFSKLKIHTFPMPVKAEHLDGFGKLLPSLFDKAQETWAAYKPSQQSLPLVEDKQKTSLMHHTTMGKHVLLIDSVPRDNKYVEDLRKELVLEKLTAVVGTGLTLSALESHISMADLIFEVPCNANVSYAVQKYVGEKKLHIILPKAYNLGTIRDTVASLYEKKFGGKPSGMDDILAFKLKPLQKA